MASIDDQIEAKIKRVKPGTILFIEDFLGIGTSGAVHISLHRLVKAKQIVRVSRGIYVKPKQSQLVGEVLPTTEAIAMAIAKRDKARILPTGSYAMHMLGLTTQIPLKLVYLTDGSPRKITIGKRTIQFKKTTPKNLSLKGDISKLAVQALKEIGKGKMTTDELDTIVSILKKEDSKKLKHDIALAPQWIAEILAKAI